MALSDEERKARRKEYEDTHKELRASWRDSHKDELAAYREKNREELNRKNREWYQKNKEKVCLRTNKYYKKNISKYDQYKKKSYGGIRLESLSKVDPSLKCANCGCDDTRFLEVNHIKGGGMKEHQKRDDGMRNMILIIRSGKRGTEDLNLLCRACNSLDHLERVYGKTGLSVVWDKKED
ncbi:hypothetical protein HQ489_00525 [Candidatus Woesearchaeota archaeon]|nr:hypothetical protein [Candidatus Woesearchaeota archaeon]